MCYIYIYECKRFLTILSIFIILIIIQYVYASVPFQDDNDTVTDFRTRFGEKLLIAHGVNITALDKEDLRCGGLVMLHNMTKLSQQRLETLSADCMVQKCDFRYLLVAGYKLTAVYL